jgi:hypothetical protein
VPLTVGIVRNLAGGSVVCFQLEALATTKVDHMNLIAAFFTGAFLCNSIPHLASGLRGEVFPTPFAKPRGRGPSSPIVNFLWGAFNFLIGVLLLSSREVAVGLNPGFASLAAGALVIGIYLSLHFGRVRGTDPTFGRF